MNDATMQAVSTDTPSLTSRGWTSLRVKDCVNINPETLSETTPEEKEIQYIDIGGVDGCGHFSVTPMTFGTAPSRARRIVKKDDIILSTVRTYLKAIAHFPRVEPNTIASTGFAILRKKVNRANARFLYRLFQSDLFTGQVMANSEGVSYPAIAPTKLGNIPVFIPVSIDKQRTIADFLDEKTSVIDTLIADKERLIELLQEKRSALISHAVTKGLDPNAPMKDSGVEWLGEIPAHWRIVPLFFSARENRERNQNNREQNVLSLSYGNIIRKDSSDNFGLLPDSYETYQIVQPEMIILRLTDLQNDKKSLRVGFVMERGIITSAYVGLEITRLLSKSFAYHLLHAYDVIKVFYNLGAGVRQTMKFSDLKRLPLLIPPAEEQQAILDFVSCTTREITDLVQDLLHSVRLLKEYRSALITAAVTGQIDVREATA